MGQSNYPDDLQIPTSIIEVVVSLVLLVLLKVVRYVLNFMIYFSWRLSEMAGKRQTFFFFQNRTKPHLLAWTLSFPFDLGEEHG